MALLIRILLALVLLAPLGALADERLELREQEIKAGLLYNFLKYADWPDSDHTVTVCVFGDDPFDGYLQPMAGRTVNQRVIQIRMIRAPGDAESCQLIFVNGGEKARWPEIRKSLSGKAALTVSDFGGFAASGGMIEFGRRDEHVSVALNMEAVTAAGLHIEDRLLKLVTVKGRP